MGKRLQAKHLKHSPNLIPQTETQKASTFLVKSRTPYVSALKTITKQLEKFEKTSNIKKFQNLQYKRVKYITVKGMGKSIEKTLSILLNFQERYKVDILTGSVEVLDEFEMEKKEGEDVDDDEEGEKVYKKRMVSSVEGRIWLKRD
ncbi:uncharacterized protein J8A68_001206 [[Candida] subhashii]|uniref:Uncharacterized protein n=1 Tax=[Candida] subhashii TaxID=561895 RepID=A0A8J5UZZ6_9ASCO|nr:uncharacterized protein J8A68_001206 [[Candida] subhashii]KAG7665150.1 hypothetical protein J8A68_001206 [[Candida] subhashii]